MRAGRNPQTRCGRLIMTQGRMLRMRGSGSDTGIPILSLSVDRGGFRDHFFESRVSPLPADPELARRLREGTRNGRTGRAGDGSMHGLDAGPGLESCEMRPSAWGFETH